jgi:lysophospholipase L1-like esterase
MVRLKKLNLIFILSAIVLTSGLKAQDELRILPLGNSLTYGYYDGTVPDNLKIGYRYKLYNLLNAAGYNFNLVGHTSTGYSVFPDAENGGFPGFRDNQLADVMQYGYYYDQWWTKHILYPTPYLDNVPADIILLHIGTNDISYGNEDFNYYTGMKKILDAVDAFESSPGGNEVLVLVAKIINKKNPDGSCSGDFWQVDYLNQVFTTEITNRINTTGDKIVMVDMQCGSGIDYNNDMLNDLHPNQTGYDKMGTMWFDVIDGLHNAPVVSTISVAPIQEGQSFAPISLDSYVTDDYTTDANITWTVSPEPVHYNVSISAGRVLTVTPKDPDWAGTEQITFIATDKGRYIEKLKKSSSVNVNFTIQSVDTPPIILSQLTTYNLDEDTSFELSLSDLEIEDDSDPSDWTLNIKPSTNYSVNGSTVTPVQDYDGTLEVNVTVSDAENESDIFVVTAFFNPENDAPVINDNDPLSLMEDSSITLELGNFDIYDPDNTIGQLTLFVLGGSNYTIDGTTVIPVENYYGDLIVNVRVQDLSEFSNTYPCTITVIDVNDPPVITSSPETTSEDNVEYNYTIVATDMENDNITFVGLKLPSWLSVDPVTGVVSGTPLKNDIGTFEISLGANDGQDITEQDYDLVIEHKNTPPVFTTVPDTFVNFNENYFYTVRATDEDGDLVHYVGIEIPYFMTFLSESGIVLGTPTETNKGVYEVIVGATDGIDTTEHVYSLYVGITTALNPVSISDLSLKIYPNPVNHTLYIEAKSVVDIESIYITDIGGRMVFSTTDIYLAEGESVGIDLSHIPTGSYLMVMNTKQGMFTQHFMISR